MPKPIPPRHIVRIIATGICSLAFLSGTAYANPFETTLPNGLKVIVKEDHRAPTIVHMIWYRAGSMDEQQGMTGVAHVLEHMMFKGTQQVPAGEFNRKVAALGGRDNAFTSRDYTAYFQIVPKAGLETVMRLESDRMHNLNLSEKEFMPEIKVVMEERRLRTEDNPQALVYEALNAAAFIASPYRWPVIGWMDDLRRMRWRDARDWYQRWYVPNNAYVVVVGDVKHEQVFSLARKTYGVWPARDLPERRISEDPAQRGERRVTIKAPAQLPYLMMAWKTPRLVDVETDRDSYALEVLAGILAGHDAARLPRTLVRTQKIAQSADAGFDATSRAPGLFLIDAAPAQGQTIAALEQALREEIKRIQNDGVTAAELQRVKIQLIATQTYKRDSMMGQAMEIGGVLAAGLDWQDIDKMVAQLGTISAQEVQDAARKYLIDDRLTVAILDPQPLPTQKAAARVSPRSPLH